MVGVYGRVQKITNANSRTNYYTNPDKQEEVVLHKVNMQYTWKEHSAFEKAHQKSNVANNEALEVHIALPNELYHDREKLEKICDELALKIIGKNKDYEYAVHWNKTRTNFHVHIMWSERENQIDLEPKIYKKDIWHDKDTHKLAKANSENAILVHKKGDIQRDKDGNIKYQTDIFKPKDTRFTQMSFVHEKNRIIESVMKAYGYNLEYQDKDSPYLAQKKLYKGARKDYLDKAKEWNKEVKRYNESVRQHIELEPIQLENYRTIKKEILKNVKEANAEEKKITPRAIQLVHDMANWVQQTLLQLKVYINRKVKELDTMQKWEEIKDKFTDMFLENKKLEQEISTKNSQINDLDMIDREYSEVIDSKLDLIHDIEKYKTRQKEMLEKLKELEPKAYKGLTREEYIKEVKGLSFEERIDKATRIIEEQERILERSWDYDRDR